MSQSRVNVANMHAWATNSMLNTQLPASTVHMCRWKQHWTLNLCYYGVDHTPHCRPRAAARTHRVMATFSLCSNVESTTRLWQRTDLVSRFARGSVARGLHAEQASRNARRFAPFVRECISMATLVCAHGTTILTNREPSELVGERIFYALQVRTRTI